MRFFVVSFVLLTVLNLPALASRVDLTGVDVNRFIKFYGTLPPTPKGEWYVDPLESGGVVHIRYALPKKRPLSFKLDIHNIVPLHGGGESYQLQLRRDRADGPVVYDGPVTNCYFWASHNRSPLEIADWLTDADLARGYLDIYAIGHVRGDKWTMWRNRKGSEWEIQSVSIDDTPELREALAGTELIRKKGICLLPWPREITAKSEDFIVSAKTRIVLRADASEDDIASAGMLRDEIEKISGRRLEVVCRGEAAGSDIVLRGGDGAPEGEQAYRLETSGKFIARAKNSTGLFYAVQTAIQLLRKKNDRIYFQGAEIIDYPSLKNRMVQYDLARYQTVNIPYLKRLVREMGRFKLNQLMLYMEDDFKYTKYPFTGKPGTFTPSSARELVAYARKYHVEVVPQLEALGHGTALLSHPEFADLRENGNPWVFCTSNPRTWQVLDDMIGELASCFDNTKYIHLGCDEFEDGFGQCAKCKERIEKIGWGGLYAEHLRRLDEIAKKHGRKMIFWTSRGGKQVEAGVDVTIRYADLLPKDIIPMEWIYDGFRTYPTIDKLQKAGFEDVYVAPGVMGYAMMNADYGLTFRSIDTFYRYGAGRNALGGCGCTWELAWGAQLETHLYGFIYSAECGWNIDASGEDAFARAFAKNWFGLKDCDPSVIWRIFHNEDNRAGKPVIWANSAGTGALFWTSCHDLMKNNKEYWPGLIAAAPDMERSADETLKLIVKLKAKASRNTVTLDAMAQTVRIYRACARRISAMDKASKLYQQAVDESKRGGLDRDRLLRSAADAIKPIKADYPDIIEGFKQARDERGAAPQDVVNAENAAKSVNDLIGKIEALAKDHEVELPSAEVVGF